MCRYCSDHYGSVLWDLNNPAVEDVCIEWCKGLSTVEFVTRNDVYVSHMFSAVGHSAELCDALFNVALRDHGDVHRRLAW